MGKGFQAFKDTHLNMLDITPRISKGKQVINRYGNGGFIVSETPYSHSIIVFPDVTIKWEVKELIKIKNITEVIKKADDIDILLIGAGGSSGSIDSELRHILKENNISVDVMDTGAACRTYNVLMAEERRVAAALIVI